MKKQKGITLIALVITIIVLLILAGVSVNALLGENGILSKTQHAVIANNNATIKENIKLQVASYTIDEKVNRETTNFFEYMRDYSGVPEVEEVTVVSSNGESLSYKDRCYIKDEGKYYTAYSDGSVEEGKIVWSGNVSESLEKDGDVFLIKSAEDLAFLSQDVRNGNTYEGCTIRLETSLDLGANKVNGTWVKGLAEWIPIGYRNNVTKEVSSFAGIFDGQDYTIRGLYVDNIDIIAGVFGQNVGVIKNLNVAYSYSVGLRSAIICGLNFGTIENYRLCTDKLLRGTA